MVLSGSAAPASLGPKASDICLITFPKLVRVTVFCLKIKAMRTIPATHWFVAGVVLRHLAQLAPSSSHVCHGPYRCQLFLFPP